MAVTGTGATVSSCNGQPAESEPLTADDKIVLALGTDSDLVVIVDQDAQTACSPLKLDISGDVAAASAPWSCTRNGMTVTYDRYAITLASDGNTLSGDAAMNMSGFLTCSATMTGTFTK